jgi:hypothetical protein
LGSEGFVDTFDVVDGQKAGRFLGTTDSKSSSLCGLVSRPQNWYVGNLILAVFTMIGSALASADSRRHAPTDITETIDEVLKEIADGVLEP